VNEQIETVIIGGAHAGLTVIAMSGLEEKLNVPFSFPQWIGWQFPGMSL